MNKHEEIKALHKLTEIANAVFDGHLTILKFTTNWRVGFGTVSTELRLNELGEPTSDTVEGLFEGKTFGEAALKAIHAVKKMKGNSL